MGPRGCVAHGETVAEAVFRPEGVFEELIPEDKERVVAVVSKLKEVLGGARVRDQLPGLPGVQEHVVVFAYAEVERFLKLSLQRHIVGHPQRAIEQV